MRAASEIKAGWMIGEEASGGFFFDRRLDLTLTGFLTSDINMTGKPVAPKDWPWRELGG